MARGNSPWQPWQYLLVLVCLSTAVTRPCGAVGRNAGRGEQASLQGLTNADVASPSPLADPPRVVGAGDAGQESHAKDTVARTLSMELQESVELAPTYTFRYEQDGVSVPMNARLSLGADGKVSALGKGVEVVIKGRAYPRTRAYQDSDLEGFTGEFHQKVDGRVVAGMVGHGGSALDFVPIGTGRAAGPEDAAGRAERASPLRHVKQHSSAAKPRRANNMLVEDTKPKGRDPKVVPERKAERPHDAPPSSTRLHEPTVLKDSVGGKADEGDTLAQGTNPEAAENHMRASPVKHAGRSEHTTGAPNAVARTTAKALTTAGRIEANENTYAIPNTDPAQAAENDMRPRSVEHTAPPENQMLVEAKDDLKPRDESDGGPLTPRIVEAKAAKPESVRGNPRKPLLGRNAPSQAASKPERRPKEAPSTTPQTNPAPGPAATPPNGVDDAEAAPSRSKDTSGVHPSARKGTGAHTPSHMAEIGYPEGTAVTDPASGVTMATASEGPEDPGRLPVKTGDSVMPGVERTPDRPVLDKYNSTASNTSTDAAGNTAAAAAAPTVSNLGYSGSVPAEAQGNTALNGTLRLPVVPDRAPIDATPQTEGGLLLPVVPDRSVILGATGIMDGFNATGNAPSVPLLDRDTRTGNDAASANNGMASAPSPSQSGSSPAGSGAQDAADNGASENNASDNNSGPDSGGPSISGPDNSGPNNSGLDSSGLHNGTELHNRTGLANSELHNSGSGINSTVVDSHHGNITGDLPNSNMDPTSNSTVGGNTEQNATSPRPDAIPPSGLIEVSTRRLVDADVVRDGAPTPPYAISKSTALVGPNSSKSRFYLSVNRVDEDGDAPVIQSVHVQSSSPTTCKPSVEDGEKLVGERLSTKADTEFAIEYYGCTHTEIVRLTVYISLDNDQSVEFEYAKASAGIISVSTMSSDGSRDGDVVAHGMVAHAYGVNATATVSPYAWTTNFYLYKTSVSAKAEKSEYIHTVDVRSTGGKECQPLLSGTAVHGARVSHTHPRTLKLSYPMTCKGVHKARVNVFVSFLGGASVEFQFLKAYAGNKEAALKSYKVSGLVSVDLPFSTWLDKVLLPSPSTVNDTAVPLWAPGANHTVLATNMTVTRADGKQYKVYGLVNSDAPAGSGVAHFDAAGNPVKDELLAGSDIEYYDETGMPVNVPQALDADTNSVNGLADANTDDEDKDKDEKKPSDTDLFRFFIGAFFWSLFSLLLCGLCCANFLKECSKIRWRRVPRKETDTHYEDLDLDWSDNGEVVQTRIAFKKATA